MKNFYEEKDLKDLISLLQPSFLDTANFCYTDFLNNLSKEEKIKLDIINQHSVINYYILFIQTVKTISNLYRDFNFYSTNFNEDPHDDTAQEFLLEDPEIVKKADEIRKLINYTTNASDVRSFDPLLAIIQNIPFLRECTICFKHFKKNGYVLAHRHNFDDGGLYILMNDIENGGLNVTVNEETRFYNKRGQWFGLNFNDKHSAYMNGDFCNLFAVFLPNYRILLQN